MLGNEDGRLSRFHPEIGNASSDLLPGLLVMEVDVKINYALLETKRRSIATSLHFFYQMSNGGRCTFANYMSQFANQVVTAFKVRKLYCVSIISYLSHIRNPGLGSWMTVVRRG